MKKNFALAVAALMMIGAAGCSTTPIENEQTSTSVPADSSSMHTEETVSSTSSSLPDLPADSSATVSDTTSAPAPVADVPPASLGASSSGRGH